MTDPEIEKVRHSLREAYREKCVMIRNRIPWNRIYQLALPWVEKVRENSVAV